MRVVAEIKGAATIDAGFVDIATRDSIPRITQHIEDLARTNLGRNVRTGRTLAGLQSKVKLTGTPTGEVGVYGNRGFIARFLEGGTRAHDIRARKAKFLVFQSGANTIRARKVHHPGTKATHWLTAAGQSAIPDAAQEVRIAIERAAKTQFARAAKDAS